MRFLIAICLLVSAACVPFAASASGIKGTVLEVKDAAGYTYLRLKTQRGETWAAINRSVVSVGEEVTLEKAFEMYDFESKALKKTFPKILFAELGNTAAGMNKAAMQSAASPPQASVDSPVAKAVGANARTVAEIVGQSGALKDKPVLVRGKVVKYNAGIMGRNWIHLRDGSGSAADGSNDILVTTSQRAKVSDLVTVQGVVRTNKDFGAGYVYQVLIEDAKLKL